MGDADVGKKRTWGRGQTTARPSVETARVTPAGTLVVFEDDVKKPPRVRQREKRKRSATPKPRKQRTRKPNSRPSGVKRSPRVATASATDPTGTPLAVRTKKKGVTPSERGRGKKPRFTVRKYTYEEKCALAERRAVREKLAAEKGTLPPWEIDDDDDDDEKDEDGAVVSQDMQARVNTVAAELAASGGGGGGGGGGCDGDRLEAGRGREAETAELEACDEEQAESIVESRQRRLAPRVGRAPIRLAEVAPERVAACRAATPPPLAFDVMSYAVEVFLFLDEACRVARTCVAYHRVARDFTRRMVWCCMPLMDWMCVGATRCRHNYVEPAGDVRRRPEFCDRPKLKTLLAEIRSGERPPQDGANVCSCKGRPFVPLFSLSEDPVRRFVPTNDVYRCTCLTQQPHGLAPGDAGRSRWCYALPDGVEKARLTPAKTTDHQRFLHILALLRRNFAELGPLSPSSRVPLLTSPPPTWAAPPPPPPPMSSLPPPPFSSSSSSSTVSSPSTVVAAAPANMAARVVWRARQCGAVAPRIVECASFGAWLRRVNLAHNVFSGCWMSADGVWFQPSVAR